MKKYHTYKAIDFAADESFILWVTRGNQDDEWQQYINRHPTQKTEIAEAKAMVETMSSYYDDSDSKNVISDQEKQNLWTRIDSETDDGKEAREIPLWKKPSIIATVAAAIIVFLVAANIWYYDTKMIKSDDGIFVDVTLPDDSKIALNLDSKIRYHTNKFDEERMIVLEGEAFFEVNKGSKFIVQLNHGQVEVLGTSFNIFSRKDSVAVICYTGAVSVSNGIAKVVLQPGEAATFSTQNNNIIKDNDFTAQIKPSWTEGVFTYDNRPLFEIFNEIERQYDVDIQYPKLVANRKVTLSFDNKNLDKALQSATYIEHMSYRKDGKNITIIND